MGMETVGKSILENIFGDLVSAVTNGTKVNIQQYMLEKHFLNCGEVLQHFENSREDSFGEAIRLVFSKENLQAIYGKLKREPGYDINAFLRQELSEICLEYDIEADVFIESFIKMFNECIYIYDKELYREIYQGEWRREEENQHNIMMSQLASMVKFVEERLGFQKNNENIPLLSNTDEVQWQEDSEAEDIWLQWDLKAPGGRGIYTTEDQKRDRLLQLTLHWKEERLKVPFWYILPVNKRDVLKIYTYDEELLYSTESAILEELFEFAFELVWRYEMGFISYSIRLLSEIRKIWDKIPFETMNSEKKEQWFYMGQALLRDYREDLDLESWNTVYKCLWEKRDVRKNGTDELLLEKVKMLFMQMKIAETKEMLVKFQCNKLEHGVRLQIAGLKAECGLLSDSRQDLYDLEKDLLYTIQSDSNKGNYVQYKSILSCVYYMLSFVSQALEPFEHGDELKELWRKNSKYSRYFDFDSEKQNFAKKLYRNLKKEKKSENFEINIESKTIIFTENRFTETYDFFRVLDRIAIPLHIGYTRLLDDDESDFMKELLENYQYIGWYMLLRFGNTKTIENLLGRRECIILNVNNEESLRKAFDYVYNSVNNNLAGIQGMDRQQHGNAYDHILLNGLEILKRLSSTANVIEQKKLINLMCRIIDMDVVNENRVLDKWIRHIMNVTEDRVKAVMLNELLTCSVKERTHREYERPVDPFDVFPIFIEAKHFYQNADIEPDIVDHMIRRAASSEKEKRYFVPRIGQMAEWDLLSEAQREEFAALLWENVTDELSMPYSDSYFTDVFLNWPSPVEMDVVKRVKRKLLDTNNFEQIKKRQLSSMTFGDSVYLQDIQNLNRNEVDFWEKEELELLINGLLDCWKILKVQFTEYTHSEFYRDEFLSRAKSLLRTIFSFSRKQIQKVDISIITNLRNMIDEMREYNIDALELEVLIVSEKELIQTEKKIISGLRLVDCGKVLSAVYAAEKILYECYDTSSFYRILKEVIVLCLYGKEPGTEYCLNAIRNILYLNKDIKLSKNILNMLYEILDNIDKKTNYEQNLGKQESEIKKIIKIRMACAGLAYQLFKYEKRRNIPESFAVSNWKDICRGKKSLKEFVEVKKYWLE